MIITISGGAGSGKSTIGKALAKRLGFPYYDIGDLRKQMAFDRGMTLQEFNALGEKESFTDKDADAYTKKLAAEKDDFVIQGRIAYFFIPGSFKIFIHVSDEVAAQRILNDKVSDRSKELIGHNMEEQKRLCRERNESDVRRYRKIYGIQDFEDPKHYDLVIDNSKTDVVEHMVDRIMVVLKEKNLLKQ